MDFSWLPKYGPLLVQGAWVTIKLLVVSAIIGNLLAVLVGFGRISRNWLVAKLALAFTSVIRGTPLLVQIYLIYYGLGSVFAAWDAIRATFLWDYLREGYWYMVVALAISTAGYTGEVVRVALLSVPRGEIEAGRAFGLSGFQVIRRSGCRAPCPPCCRRSRGRRCCC